MFVFATFASMYDLILQNLHYQKSLLENFKQYIVEKTSNNTSLKSFKIRIVEKIRKLVVLKEFARKLQNTHCWKSLHESFKLNSSKYWAKDTSDCCEKVLKIQFSQMLQSKFNCINRSIEINVLTFAHFLCFHLHVFYLKDEISKQWMIIIHKSFNKVDHFFNNCFSINQNANYESQ